MAGNSVNIPQLHSKADSQFYDEPGNLFKDLLKVYKAKRVRMGLLPSSTPLDMNVVDRLWVWLHPSQNHLFLETLMKGILKDGEITEISQLKGKSTTLPLES